MAEPELFTLSVLVKPDHKMVFRVTADVAKGFAEGFHNPSNATVCFAHSKGESGLRLSEVIAYEIPQEVSELIFNDV